MGTTVFVGVIGAGSCSEDIYSLARELGFQIGKKSWALVCGGLGGVMEGAARGCREAGGLTVGLLPGLDRESANPYISVSLPTGLGDGRNLLVVRCADVLISIAGSYGTLSEIALALKGGKTVIGLKTWEAIPGVQYAENCDEAIEMVERQLLGA
jgi:uncharacterized protein (TIGR00725 family)